MKVGPQADKFGSFLMAKLRDPALDFYDALVHGPLRSARTQQLQAAIRAMTPEQRAVVRRCVLIAVDHGLHDFLLSLSEVGNPNSGVEVVVDGQNIAAQSDGLHGELFGDNGWFVRYSRHGEQSDPA